MEESIYDIDGDGSEAEARAQQAFFRKGEVRLREHVCQIQFNKDFEKFK
jgi:hypothetical protein